MFIPCNGRDYHKGDHKTNWNHNCPLYAGYKNIMHPSITWFIAKKYGNTCLLCIFCFIVKVIFFCLKHHTLLVDNIFYGFFCRLCHF